jgi:cell division control protein 6
MYVSGPPGTGKTALVQEVTTGIQSDVTFKKAYVNCMSMNSSNDIYTTILGALRKDCGTLKDDAMRSLQSMFVSRKRTSTVYLVILDEVDHILTLDQEALYKIFEWSLQISSRLILIGIANALDLTDRFLPRLKARTLKPCLLPILPYNANQVKDIIIVRLKSLVPANCTDGNFVPFIHPAAIELCSRKISSQTGDLRKAFDICRRAIELIESETKQKHYQALDEQAPKSPSKMPLAENANLSSPSPEKVSQQKPLSLPLSGLTVETAPRASISHINKITSTLGNGTNQRLNILNLQQKAALCALVALERRQRNLAMNVMTTPSKSHNAAPTIKALYSTYSALCKRDSILHPLTSIEFRDVIGSLETLSLVSAVDGKTGSLVLSSTPSKRGRKVGFGGGVGAGDEKRVVSCVSEKELGQAVQGPGSSILVSILNGEGLD